MSPPAPRYRHASWGKRGGRSGGSNHKDKQCIRHARRVDRGERRRTLWTKLLSCGSTPIGLTRCKICCRARHDAKLAADTRESAANFHLTRTITTPTQVRRVRVRAHLRVPRLPTPRLPAPRLPAPRLPAPRLPARCLPHLHRLVACRIHTREACRPVSATPPPPSLLACAKRCDSAPSRLLEHATLRQLCDPVRLCT